jgi:prefoldin subunit 5
MRFLKRFNEKKEILDLSPERLGEIEKSLTEFTSELSAKLELIDSYLNELENYTTGEGDNDQIDESILNLQVVRKNIEESLDKTDNAINQLKDYGDKGRQYLFGDEDE